MPGVMTVHRQAHGPQRQGFRVSGYEDDVFSRDRAQMMLWRNLQIRLLFALAALVLLTVASNGSASAAYPDRVVKIVVPFAPGGGTDVVARTLALEMAKKPRRQGRIAMRPEYSGIAGVAERRRSMPIVAPIF
jgi:hypothetical protein